MSINEILAALDSEILRLQEVKALLSRPTTNGSALAPKKRAMSPEGKARIVAAQKKRWAKVKKAVK
jgi:hypothetical protein